MQAAVYSRYGPPDVVHIADVEKPVPADDEVLVQVCAASVNPLDWHGLRGSPLLIRLGSGLRRPNDPRLGVDVAGRIEAVGRNVTQFRAGDEVFGACRGAFAEYTCAKPDRLALKPAGVSFAAAAAVPVAAVTALQGLRDKGRIQAGQKVLVDGASGGVGTFAVQIARALGTEVTAVCSTSKVATALECGASHVIDYTRENFTRSQRRYDLILAANSFHSIFDYRRALSPGGTYVMAGGGLPQVAQAGLLGPVLSRLGDKKMRFFVASFNPADMALLRDFLAAGKIRPVIDRSYPLSRVAEALAYLEQGHARGKVVITMDTPS